MVKLYATLLLALAAANASARTCLLATQDWWKYADTVALVRVNSTGVVAAPPFRSGACAKGEACNVKQSASFTTVETFKGSLARVRRLQSGYGSGDGGIPLVAGAYYVVFSSGVEGQISFCNAAGPYPPRYPYTGRYPQYLESFLSSLRRAAQQPGEKVLPRPKPMTYDALGGL